MDMKLSKCNINEGLTPKIQHYNKIFDCLTDCPVLDLSPLFCLFLYWKYIGHHRWLSFWRNASRFLKIHQKYLYLQYKYVAFCIENTLITIADCLFGGRNEDVEKSWRSYQQPSGPAPFPWKIRISWLVVDNLSQERMIMIW